MPYNNNYRPGGAARQGGATQQSDNVTSTGINFINESVGKFMNFNYWGRTVSIEIGVCPAGSPLTWDVKKNAQLFRQVFSFTSLADLCEMCDEVYDSVKTSGGFTPVGVRVGSKKDAIVELSNGENLGLQTGIYLVIYKNLDNTNRTNMLEFYQFDNTKFIRSYNHSTGAGKEDINKLGEFKKFRRAVNEAANAFTMAQAHTISELKKGDKMAAFKALAAVSAAMGVDMTPSLLGTKTVGSSSYSQGSGSSQGYQKKAYGQSNYQRSSYNAPRQGGTFERPATPPPAGFQPNITSMADEPVDINLDLKALQEVALSDFTNG